MGIKVILYEIDFLVGESSLRHTKTLALLA